MRAAAVADQQRVALRVVAGVLGAAPHADQTAVGVLAAAGRNAFRHDAAARVAADMDHLGAGVGLLEVVGHGHRVELAHRIVARQHAAGVLPRDGRPGLDLRPRQAGVLAAQAALGDEVVDAAAPLAVARIPVLHRGVFHLGVALDHDFDHGGVQLVLVAAGRRAPLQVAHVGALVSHDERALELSRTRRIDAEVGRELHRAAHPLGDVAERAVGEDGGVERRVEVVGVRHHAAQVLAHQLGMLLQGLRDRAEDDALLGQRLAERGLHRHGVHHRIDRHARERHLLLQRNAQLVERAPQLGIDLVHRARTFGLLGRGVVDHVLEIYFGNVEMGPRGGRQRQPVAVSLQTGLGHPLRLALLRGNEPHDLLAQPLTDGFGLDRRGEAVAVLAVAELLQYLFLFFCHTRELVGQRYEILCNSQSGIAILVPIVPRRRLPAAGS